MERKEYNGWTNYETWCVNLWMSNDSGTDDYFRTMAQDTWNESEPETRKDGSVLFTREEVATRTLADRLKDEHEERQPDYLSQSAGVFADLLNAALSEVDWYSIAEHYIADVDKPVTVSAESEEN